MSRLFRDRLLISLAPQSVALLRVSGTLRPSVLEAVAHACDSEFGSAPWHGALDTLRATLVSLRRERLDVTVVLSNHFVRYALVPWSEELDSPDEELAFARHVFAGTYGERAKTWEIRLSEETPGAARLASAVERGLLEELRGCFPDSGKPRLVSVQPFLMSTFNLWRRRLGSEAAWFVLVEPGRACLARFSKGRWAAVRNARARLESPEDFAALIERERHVAEDGGAETVYYYATTAKPLDAAGNRTLSPLELPSGTEARNDLRFALALTAV